MEVQTYEVEEIKSSDAATMAADSESIALCEKLGLKGQMRLTDKETDTRCPYRKITAIEKLVFEAVFPEKTSVDEYASGIMPLRVLQVLAHAKEIPLFKGFVVLHPTDARQKDPVLLAFTGSSYDWNPGDVFLLARWGDALDAFEVLTEKAKKIWTNARKLACKEIIAKGERALENAESDAELIFLTGTIKTEQLFL